MTFFKAIQFDQLPSKEKDSASDQNNTTLEDRVIALEYQYNNLNTKIDKIFALLSLPLILKSNLSDISAKSNSTNQLSLRRLFSIEITVKNIDIFDFIEIGEFV
jgi:hypothetical protein